MEDLYRTIAPAAIALIGTIITLLFGYWQWKRQQKTGHQENFRIAQQEAYKKLWSMVENTHAEIRIDGIDEREYSELVKQVNLFTTTIPSPIMGWRRAEKPGK